MKEVGFDGYSIHELLTYMDGLKIFRFLGFPKGHLQGVQELGFLAGFDSSQSRDITVQKFSEVWTQLSGKKADYYWTANPLIDEPLNVHFRFVKAPDGFEEEDFQFAKTFEPELVSILNSISVRIRDQPDFKFRGFDRTLYS